MKVKAYFNLHSGLWSLMAIDGRHAGRVIAHAESVELVNVVFKVSEKGRQRVLREQRKNVHAFAIGELVGLEGMRLRYNEPRAEFARQTVKSNPESVACSYNPYKGANFYRKDTGADVYGAERLVMRADKSIHAEFAGA